MKLESTEKEKLDQKQHYEQKAKILQQSANNDQLKALQDENSKMRSLNKNREQMLQEMDQKNKTIREHETKLKLL